MQPLYPDWLPAVNHDAATIELFSGSCSRESRETGHHSSDLTKCLQDALRVFSQIGTWNEVSGAGLICGGVYDFGHALPQYQGRMPSDDPLLFHWISAGETIGDGHFR